MGAKNTIAKKGKPPNKSQVRDPYLIKPIEPPSPGPYQTDYAAYLRDYGLYVTSVLAQRSKMNSLAKAKEAARPKKKVIDPVDQALKARLPGITKTRTLVEEVLVPKELEESRTIPAIEPRPKRWICNEGHPVGQHADGRWVGARGDLNGHDMCLYGRCNNSYWDPEVLGSPARTETRTVVIQEAVKVRKTVEVPPSAQKVAALKDQIKHERAVEKRRRYRANKAKRQKALIAKSKTLPPLEAKVLKKKIDKLERDFTVVKSKSTKKKEKKKGKSSVTLPVAKKDYITYPSKGAVFDVLRVSIRKAHEELRRRARVDGAVREVIPAEGFQDQILGLWSTEKYRRLQDMLSAWESGQIKIHSALDDDLRNFVCPKIRPFRWPKT